MHLQTETMMMVCAPFSSLSLNYPFFSRVELGHATRNRIGSIQVFLIRKKRKVDIGVDSRHCSSVGAVIIVAFSRRAHVS